MLQCKTCSTIFSSGMTASNCGAIIFTDYRVRCPKCGALESIPDGTSQATVDGVASLLLNSTNPLHGVSDILEALEDSRRQKTIAPLQSKSWYAAFKQWLPDTPEKIAAYITIFAAIHQILAKDPSQHIEYSPTFIEQYNQTIIYNAAPVDPRQSQNRKQQKESKGFG
jgi:hypothetical protein